MKTVNSWRDMLLTIRVVSFLCILFTIFITYFRCLLYSADIVFVLKPCYTDGFSMPMSPLYYWLKVIISLLISILVLITRKKNIITLLFYFVFTDRICIKELILGYWVLLSILFNLECFCDNNCVKYFIDLSNPAIPYSCSSPLQALSHVPNYSPQRRKAQSAARSLASLGPAQLAPRSARNVPENMSRDGPKAIPQDFQKKSHKCL